MAAPKTIKRATTPPPTVGQQRARARYAKKAGIKLSKDDMDRIREEWRSAQR